MSEFSIAPGPKQRQHETFVAQHLARNVTDDAKRAGVRCGLSDSAHLCDAIAADLEASMRKSKRRDELVAIAKACGNAIWEMRKLASGEPPSPQSTP
jgi:hypothetical protein